MATEVKIPAINQSFYKDYEIKQTKDKLDSIYLKYKTYIDQAARLTNVDKDIITSLIFIESSGDVNAVSGAGAVGLMQLVPAAASDILVTENLKKRLDDGKENIANGEKSILRKFLGNRFTNGILKMKYLGQQVVVDGVSGAVWVTKKDLLNPELNILIGAIYLGLLIDESIEDGKLRLDKIIVRYNVGYFAQKRGTLLPKSVQLSMLSNLPTETKNYILKFAGLNGTLDLLKA